MINLKELTLYGFKADNLEFFELLLESMYLDLCGIEVKREYDLSTLSRLPQRQICEMTIAGNWI